MSAATEAPAEASQTSAARCVINGNDCSANAKVSAAEQIKKFDVLATDFTIDTGELTPTLKLKRNVIHDTYKQAIADLYS